MKGEAKQSSTACQIITQNVADNFPRVHVPTVAWCDLPPPSTEGSAEQEEDYCNPFLPMTSRPCNLLARLVAKSCLLMSTPTLQEKVLVRLHCIDK